MSLEQDHYWLKKQSGNKCSVWQVYWKELLENKEMKSSVGQSNLSKYIQFQWTLLSLGFRVHSSDSNWPSVGMITIWERKWAFCAFPCSSQNTSFSNSVFSWTSGEEATTISSPFTRKGEIKRVSDHLTYQHPGQVWTWVAITALLWGEAALSSNLLPHTHT